METWIPPWLDTRLTEETMNYLWDIINHTDPQANVRKEFGGPNSKSYWIHDNKDNWFYENVLKECTDHLIFREWNNYYNVHIAKTTPYPVFTLKDLWVNRYKQHEFSPPHTHMDGIGFSFVVFMKIPTHWKEQRALPWLKDVKESHASDFQFILGKGQRVQDISISLSPEEEGRMLFFPAWLAHQVFPFYGTEEERITVAGNIVIAPTKNKEEMENYVFVNKNEHIATREKIKT